MGNKPIVTSQINRPRKAGDMEPFPSGKITYLAPLPLPTLMPPYGPHIGELNDEYMDFGLGSPQIFSWQVILGGGTHHDLHVVCLTTYIQFLFRSRFGVRLAVFMGVCGAIIFSVIKTRIVDRICNAIHRTRRLAPQPQKTCLNHPNPLQPSTPRSLLHARR